MPSAVMTSEDTAGFRAYMASPKIIDAAASPNTGTPSGRGVTVAAEWAAGDAESPRDVHIEAAVGTLGVKRLVHLLRLLHLADIM